VSAQVVNDFSAIATWLVPVIFIAGLAMTALLVPSLRVFSQPYGLLLLSKMAGFAVLIILAALNKWRLGPAIARSPDGSLQRSGASFQRSVLAEYVLIFSVLATTAVMTTFFSPD
jgi:putative copper resistance protein D